MKKSVITTPIFTPSTRTIDTKITDFNIKKLYAIINQTSDTLIYGTGTQGRGYSTVSGTTIVLDYDTTAMSSTDILQILYDDSEDIELAQALYEVLERLSFLTSIRGTLGDIRVTPTGTVTTSISGTPSVSISGTPTVNSTTTNQTSMGGYSANNQIPALQNMTAIESNINNISVTIS